MNHFEYEIADFYIEETRRLAATIAKKALVTIEENIYEYPIVKTVIRDGFLKHYIEIEDEPVGNISRAVLVNENNIPLVSGEGLIEKGDDGWQIAFKLFIEVATNEGEEV